MTLNRRPLLALIVIAGIPAASLGCGNTTGSNNSGGGGPTGPPSFANTVVIGDSLSAGFQNGSLLDSQQPNGWASLVATQGNFTLTLPLIAPPGAPAVLQLISVGPPPVITQASGTTTGRDNPDQQPTDLAVPGHKLTDLINYAPPVVPVSDEDIITDFVLGFPLGNNKTQMNEAIQLNPTVLFVWIGNNDALAADESGVVTSMTSVSDFTQQFQQLMSTLHAQTTATLVVGNLPDVTAIPYLTPATSVIAKVAAETGLSEAQVAIDLGIQDGDLINATGQGQVQSAVTAIQGGQTPVPLTDAGFLSASETTQVQSTVSQYNSAIAQEVSAVGGVLVDIHTLFQNLQSGITINGYNATTAFLGGLFSLDGIHPTNTGYGLIANEFMDSMNSSLKTTFADVDVSAIAAVDPLFGSNLKAMRAKVAIPVGAARIADRVIALRNAPR